MRRSIGRRGRIAPAVALAITLAAAVPASGASGLDQRISLDLEGAGLEETLRSFGAVLQADAVEIDPEVSGTVTIHLENVRVETALDAVCEGAGCAWLLVDGELVITSLGDEPAGDRAAAEGALDQRVDLDLADAELQETLRTFGRIVQVPVSVDPAIQGRVTVRIEDTPVRKVLDRLCEDHGCRWELTGGGEPVLRFTAEG